MIDGIIVKGIGGFYYVDIGHDLVECRARGLFRLKNTVPMVGDKVKIQIDNANNQGFIMDIKERKNEMIRPAVSNIDQVIIIFAAKDPDINIDLLQRFLVYAEYIGLKIVVCINKIDLDKGKDYLTIINMVESIPYNIIKTSVKENIGANEIKEYLKDNASVLAGPSGVGKSSILNMVIPEIKLKTGEISQKTKRGVHTTRHVELIKTGFGGMVVDTPGFTSFDLLKINEEELQFYYPEFKEHLNCRFPSCRHDKEPDCGVKEAVKKGIINELRYNGYIKILNESIGNRRY